METKTWTSKESDHFAIVTLKQVGTSKIAELDYTYDVDDIALRYKSTKEKTEKKALKEQYQQLALQHNQNKKHQIFNPSI